jgi:hypothetical protein
MKQANLKLNKNKPQFSGHETFPLRQLWLRKAYSKVQISQSIGQKNNKGLFSNDDAIVNFGVGKNMALAIRHWALACEIIDESDELGYVTTTLGDQLFGEGGLDPFQEHPSTAWLIHWKLAGEGNRSTTWKWLFNYVLEQTIDTENLLINLKNFANDNGYKVSPISLKRDIECCLRSYVPRSVEDSPEEIADSVLGELSLLSQTSRGHFEFSRGNKKSLKDGLFAYALVNFWESYSPETATISFESIAHEHGSPGRVFKLDEATVLDRVQGLGDATKGKLNWSDTAGMKQVSRKLVLTEKEKLNLLISAYA